LEIANYWKLSTIGNYQLLKNINDLKLASIGHFQLLEMPNN